MNYFKYYSASYKIRIINGDEHVVYPGSCIKNQIHDWLLDLKLFGIAKMPAHVKKFFNENGCID